jgi:hypothetical protein
MAPDLPGSQEGMGQVEGGDSPAPSKQELRTDYLSMTPQAIRAPELPAGSVL